jgi:hypothetical protein
VVEVLYAGRQHQMGSGGRQCMFWNTVSIIMNFFSKKVKGLIPHSL